MLLFCLTTKTYLLPQLLVYMPIDVPVHDPTCSFWYLHSDKLLLFTCPLTCYSTYSQTYGCISSSFFFTCTLICQLICWSAYRQTHPKMNVPFKIWLTTKIYLSNQLSTCPQMHPFENSTRSFSCPFRITSTISPSTQLLLYKYTDLPGNKYTCLSWCFLSG